MNRNLRKSILSLFVVFIFIGFVYSTNAYAAWNTNATEFVDTYGEKMAKYKDGAFWFSQRGTEGSGTRYAIIGFKATVNINNVNYVVHSNIGNSSLVNLVHEGKKDNTNFIDTLWKVDYNKLYSKLCSKYPNVNFDSMLDMSKNTTIIFDAIMTTKTIDSKGNVTYYGAVNVDGNTSSGDVYRDFNGISGAASWDGVTHAQYLANIASSTRDDLKKLFNIKGELPAKEKPKPSSIGIGDGPVVLTDPNSKYVSKINDKSYYVREHANITTYYTGYTTNSLQCYRLNGMFYLINNKNTNKDDYILGKLPQAVTTSTTNQYDIHRSSGDMTIMETYLKRHSNDVLKADFLLNAQYRGDGTSFVLYPNTRVYTEDKFSDPNAVAYRTDMLVASKSLTLVVDGKPPMANYGYEKQISQFYDNNKFVIYQQAIVDSGSGVDESSGNSPWAYVYKAGSTDKGSKIELKKRENYEDWYYDNYDLSSILGSYDGNFVVEVWAGDNVSNT